MIHEMVKQNEINEDNLEACGADKLHKQTKITDYYKVKKTYGYNVKTGDWHCTVCGISMGRGNPRQLCSKSYCSGI